MLLGATWQRRGQRCCSGWWGRAGPPSPKGARATLPHHAGARGSGPVGSGGPLPGAAPEPGCPRAGLGRRGRPDRGRLRRSARGTRPRRCCCLGRGRARRGTGAGGPRRHLVPTARHRGDLAAHARLRGRVRAGSSVPCSAWVGSFRGRRSKLFGWLGNVPTGIKGGQAARRGTRTACTRRHVSARKRRSRPERYTPVSSGPHGMPAGSTRTGGTEADRGARPRTAAGRRPGPGWGPVQQPGLVVTSSKSDGAEQVRRSRAGPTELPTVRTPPAMPHHGRVGWLRSVGASAGTARKTQGRSGHHARFGCWAVGGCGGWRSTTPSKSV